jgi:uncharacterized membrane protein
MVLNRFWQFEAFYFDHGIFDSSLWQVAQGSWPIIDHLEDGFIRQFGDHFTPTMYLLVPLYWFTRAYEPLLIIGNLFVAVSAFVLFKIAARKILNRLMVLAIVMAYTLFVGLQNTIIANFHTELIALTTLAVALWAMDLKKWKLFWIFLFLTLGCKQNFAAIGVGLGAYLFLTSERKLGIATAAVSLLYYVFATKIAIPMVGLRPYAYGTNLYSFSEMLMALFSPPIKLETVLATLFTFGGLPVFGWSFLPAILQDFGTRFVFSTPARWDLGLHYNATLALLSAYGSILGVVFLLKFKSYKKLITIHALLIIVVVLFLHRFKYHGALGLTYNSDFYRHAPEMKFLKNFISEVPPNKMVMTQNNLAAHLTHSDRVMLLRDDYWKFMPEVIAIDTREGQNPANYWPLNQYSFDRLAQRLATDPNFTAKKISNQQIIYLKNSWPNLGRIH